MDIMPWSRAYSKLIGIEWVPSGTLSRRCFNYWIRSCMFIFSFSVVMMQVYSMLFHETMLVINLSFITYYSIQTLSWTWMLTRSGKMYVVIMWTAERLNKRTVSKVNAYDRRHMIILLAYVSSTVTLLSVYFCLIGLKPELTVMALGYYTQGEPVPKYALVPCALFYVANLFWSPMQQMYISILFLSVQVADKAHRDTERERSSLRPDYDLIRSRLHWYNELMKGTNDGAGILPFSLLAMEFAAFSTSITFLVNGGSQFQFSPYFAALTIGFMNLLYIMMVLQFISLADKSYSTASNAWQVAHACITDPILSCDKTAERERMRESLKFFMTTESVTRAQAFGIIIEGSLILAFFSQLIPFTVMLFTTLKELEKNSSHGN